MPFFERPPPREPEEELPVPPWFEPPWGVIGGAVAESFFLARNDRVAVGITAMLAFPTGIQLTVLSFSRDRFVRLDPDPYEWRAAATKGLPDEMLRFGVQFPDGSKATTTGAEPFDETEPSGPVLQALRGGGGNGEWSQDYWVWPLPPPGRLAFVCEWPAHGIELTRVEIDADRIREAAGRAERAWPDDDAPGSGGSNPPTGPSGGWTPYARIRK